VFIRGHDVGQHWHFQPFGRRPVLNILHLPTISHVLFIMARQQKVARSIVYAILENDGAKVRSLVSRILAAIVSFFALYQLQLTRLRNDIFGHLREKWQVDDEYYKDSFGKKDSLEANGDMGFSGSVSRLYTSHV
jgi:hypothetical protein